MSANKTNAKAKNAEVSALKEKIFSYIKALIYWKGIVSKNGEVTVYVDGVESENIKRRDVTYARDELKSLLSDLGDSYKRKKPDDKCLKSGNTGAFGNPRVITSELQDFFLKAPMLAPYVEKLDLLREGIIAQGIYTMLMTIYAYDHTSPDRSILAFRSYRNIDMIKQELATILEDRETGQKVADLINSDPILSAMRDGQPVAGQSTEEIFAALNSVGITNSSKFERDSGRTKNGKAVMTNVKIINGKYLGVDDFMEDALKSSLDRFDTQWVRKVERGDVNKAGKLQGFESIDFADNDGTIIPHDRHNFAFSDLQTILGLNTVKFDKLDDRVLIDKLSADGVKPGISASEKALFKKMVKPLMGTFDTAYCDAIDQINRYAGGKDKDKEKVTARTVEDALAAMEAAKSNFVSFDGDAVIVNLDLGDLSEAAITDLRIKDDLQLAKISRANFSADAILPVVQA